MSFGYIFITHVMQLCSRPKVSSSFSRMHMFCLFSTLTCCKVAFPLSTEYQRKWCKAFWEWASTFFNDTKTFKWREPGVSEEPNCWSRRWRMSTPTKKIERSDYEWIHPYVLIDYVTRRRGNLYLPGRLSFQSFIPCGFLYPYDIIAEG